jgi:hypothetical protein
VGSLCGGPHRAGGAIEEEARHRYLRLREYLREGEGKRGERDLNRYCT